MYETILFEATDGVGHLVLNRPERLNGITNRMLSEVHDCLEALAERKDVRVLVLTGAGRGFCPGADLKHYSGGEEDVKSSPRHYRISQFLHQMPQVTLAAINGACAGAGFGWACACDLRFAARSATFNSAFLNVASAGDMAGPWSLPRLVGAAKARELYFIPDKFRADDALRMGGCPPHAAHSGPTLFHSAFSFTRTDPEPALVQTLTSVWSLPSLPASS